MDLGIQDRLALVTGASRGIGRAIAIQLAREGVRVILVARTQQDLEAVRRELQGPARSHHHFCADLISPEELSQFAQAVMSQLGPPDIIVHNVGGSLGTRDTFASVADWQKVWQFNLGIAIELNRIFIPSMIEKKWGRVVHLSTLSTTTYLGNPAYVAAKCALNAYVKSMSREVARHNVIVSAVAPGAIYSEGRYFAKLQREDPIAMEEYYRNHLPIGRLGRAEEIAPVVVFLCSDLASFMNGAIVPVDGGGV